MKKFGPYELLRRMGAGATAEVYLASGPTPHGEGLLALKIVLAHLAEDPAQRTGLLKEARTSSLLHDPHVVEIYEVGEHEARPYLAMELVRGWSAAALQKKLKARGERLAPSEACELVRQAALGLHYAHELAGADGRPLGLVHRDVSPQNLIVSEEGRVKVVDFGLAKATAVQATQTTGIKGKLPYMPPEQLKGEALDRRVDVFALGAVLWELSCGTLLYPGATEAEVFQQALFLPQPHPDEVAKGLSRPLVEVLLRAVARELPKRFPTALALAEALSPLVSPGAVEGLAARIRDCFEPLPRSASEALGLPETPQPLPRTATSTRGLPSGPQPPRDASEGRGLKAALPPRLTGETRGAAEASLPRRPTSETRGPGEGPLPTGPRSGPRRPTRGAVPVSVPAAEAHDTLDEPEDEDPGSTLDEGDEPAGLTTWREDDEARRRRRTTIIAASLIGACLAGGLTVMARPLFSAAPPPEPKAPIADAPPPAAPAPPRAPDKHPKKAPKGTLVVHTNVAAFVREKGVDLGMTPLTVPLPAGRHLLTLVSADARLSAELEVTLAGGETATREVTLK